MAKTKQDDTKRHVWYVRMAPDQEARTYEFGMAISAQDAGNRIAKLHGMRGLPDGAVLSWRELESLKAVKAAKKEAV